MNKPSGNNPTQGAGRIADKSKLTSPSPAAAIPTRTHSKKNSMTEAQEEYLEDMRTSVKQMMTGEVRPLSELLEELRQERETNYQAHLDDQDI